MKFSDRLIKIAKKLKRAAEEAGVVSLPRKDAIKLYTQKFMEKCDDRMLKGFLTDRYNFKFKGMVLDGSLTKEQLDNLVKTVVQDPEKVLMELVDHFEELFEGASNREISRQFSELDPSTILYIEE